MTPTRGRCISGMLSYGRHVKTRWRDRESVLTAWVPWNATRIPLFCHDLSFSQRLHTSHLIGRRWSGRETTKLCSMSWRARPLGERRRGGSWFCKHCTKHMSLDYLWSLRVRLCIQRSAFSHEPRWRLLQRLKGNFLGFPLRRKSPG